MQPPVIPWTEYFSSVGDVWLLWLIGVSCFCWLVRRSLRRASWHNLRAFAADERGASYALGYVMVFPAYLLLMCLILQATLILMVKMGTVYASYSAARTAIVWRPSQPERPSDTDNRYQFAKKRTHRAAALAMAPFASGFQHHLNKAQPLARFNLFKQAEAVLYESMYQRLAKHTRDTDTGKSFYPIQRFGPKALARKQYVKNKLLFAAAATSVEMPEEIPAWNTDFAVTVTYTMPMHVPAVGRVFGSWYKPFYGRDISTTTTLPSEAPETASKRMNIPYDPEQLVLY